MWTKCNCWMLEHEINIVSIVLQTSKLTQWLVTASTDQGQLELDSSNCSHSFNKITHYNWFSCIHSNCTWIIRLGGYALHRACSAHSLRLKSCPRQSATLSADTPLAWQSRDRIPKQFWKITGCLFTLTHITFIIIFVKIWYKQWHLSLCGELDFFYICFALLAAYFTVYEV